MVAGMLMQARRAGRWRRTCDPRSRGRGEERRRRGSLVTLVALNSPSPFPRPFSPFKLGSHRSDKIDAQDGARHKYSNKSSRAAETRQEAQFIRSRKIKFRSEANENARGVQY